MPEFPYRIFDIESLGPNFEIRSTVVCGVTHLQLLSYKEIEAEVTHTRLKADKGEFGPLFVYTEDSKKTRADVLALFMEVIDICHAESGSSATEKSG